MQIRLIKKNFYNNVYDSFKFKKINKQILIYRFLKERFYKKYNL